MPSERDKARRWFGIRDLLYLILIAALGVGWLIDSVRSARDYQELESDFEAVKPRIKRIKGELVHEPSDPMFERVRRQADRSKQED